MTTLRLASILIPAFALTLGASGGAQADPLVANGNFSQYTGGYTGGSYTNAPSQINNSATGGYTSLTGWTVSYSGSSTPSNAVYGYTNLFNSSGNLAFKSYYPSQSDFLGFDTNPSAPPGGGNFVGIDGYGGTANKTELSQTIAGLVVGQQYTLTFNWAAAEYNTVSSTAYTEQFIVGFGGQATQSTAVLSQAAGTASAWYTVSMVFTADSSTSEVLSFLANGTPSNGPPIGLLSDVQLVPGVVPEPSTLVLMGIGMVGFGVVGYRRRAKAATV